MHNLEKELVYYLREKCETHERSGWALATQPLSKEAPWAPQPTETL